ncbi:MAG: hypothetical protein APR53_05635 [Methanoculleus sp. SDB]|nr:MAG: hypothetical protein APR53_05635 [Methanoculleus sp. SDB]
MADKKTRIIACGNPLMGNDGVGPAVLDCLLADHPDLDAVEGGLGGLGLLPLIEDYDRVIIIDAMTGYGRKGDVRIFREPPDSRFFPMSLHDIGVVEALAVAKEIGYTTEVIIIAVEGGVIDTFGDTLDPEVRAVVPRVCRMVLEEWEKG